MDWTLLSTVEQLDAVDEASKHKPILLFKHSTTCSISRTALDRLQRSWSDADDAAHEPYLLDLHRYRSVSNAIAGRYGIAHESPQVLVIKNGRCVHDASHFGITYAGTKQALEG
ncbi:MAG: bacillithiol system redox-active protein YtxJ [Flavobacteriales bacterium]|nr:bacillithiol system redox-active protein YtxJ [Flavobacteriales bacterium]